MYDVFNNTAGFSVDKSNLFFMGVLSVCAVILVILSVMSAYKLRTDDGDFTDGDFLFLIVRVLAFLIIISFIF